MEGLVEAIIGFIIMVAVLAFTFGVIAMLAIPKLWEIVKPFLHTLTA